MRPSSGPAPAAGPAPLTLCSPLAAYTHPTLFEAASRFPDRDTEAAVNEMALCHNQPG